MASDASRDEAAPVEFAAPEGWRKMYALKKDGTPKKSEVVFISPTGEEIKSKKQLDRYLKSHPGGPSVSEFDWSTGATPRRSVRLSQKSQATETPDSEPPKKRQNTSSSKKGAKGQRDDEDDGDAEKKEESVTIEPIVGSKEAQTKDTDNLDSSQGGAASTKEDVTVGDIKRDSEGKVDEMHIDDMVNEGAVNEPVEDAKNDSEEKADEKDLDKTGVKGAVNEESAAVANANSVRSDPMEKSEEEAEEKVPESEALHKLDCQEADGDKSSNPEDKKLNSEEVVVKNLAGSETSHILDNQEADKRTSSNAQNEQLFSDSVQQTSSESYVSKEKAEEKSLGFEEQASLPLQNDSSAFVEKTNGKNDTLLEADAKLEKETEDKVGEKAVPNNEASADLSVNVE